MEKILPIAEPIVSSYPRYGHIFSVIGAHTQEHLPWVYNFFVHLYAPDKLVGEGQLDYVGPNIFTKIPWLEINYMKRDVSFKKMNSLQLIKEYINYDFYFWAPFKMSDLAADKNDIEYHDLLIYGYSDEKEEFYFADNYEGGKYEFGVASYKEIEYAINNYDGDDTHNINCLKYRNDKTWKIFEFDKKTYISFLRDYIEQTNCTRCWGVPGVEYKFLEQKRWGIGVYAYIHEYLDAVQKAEIETGNRALYVIREHKNILEKTLTYLLGVQWKETYPQEWKLLEMSIQIANKVLDLFEEYERSFDKQMIDRIKGYITELEMNDYKLFPRLISILEEK